MRLKKEYEKGQLIGGLIFVRDSNYSKHRKAFFLCPYCGIEFEAIIANVKRKNHTRSCGCQTSKLISEKITKHKKTNHPLYFVWHDLKNRCLNKKYKYYHRYGGRGITVCNEWKSNFKLFYDWCISNGWSKGLQLDREDNNGNYEPNNCRFITSIDNVRNSSTTKMSEHKVRVLKRMIRKYPNKSDIELSKYFNVSRVCIYDIRISKTWTDINIT